MTSTGEPGNTIVVGYTSKVAKELLSLETLNTDHRAANPAVVMQEEEGHGF